MWSAILWGTIAASATLFGALTVIFLSVPKRLIGFIMALGTGALIGATTYELLGDALKLSGFKEVAIGFLGGALLFTLLDMWVSHSGGNQRKWSDQSGENKSKSGAGLGTFIGTIMDTLPESAMIGLSLVGGQSVSFALVIAIFISNFPEGLSSTYGLQKSGFSNRKILIMWIFVVVFSALSSLAGALFLDGTSNSIKAIMSAFAGGAIIAMVASTMMPEAYKEGGPSVGFITATGVFISLFLHHY
ncbi:ZIP family metal transporter [Aquibacillus sp. 3ASR75-11]|uniref:ZIP family metal transporter n=1 Tax=Terrihalobacillus insolitus TaxID=2950438 RepID=A0A9X3WQ90_9BACI|nr:ZIP family metal transporter [Terrihalobacillus insolitus]MDC3412708.1 ZIP family metal transporter [Terrihalobacillus insolitus]MDC3423815.1 ZIP family metal transporter [Terrihalobacillus insolitus]